MTNSVWPQDTYIETDVPIRDLSMEMTCFVALPSEPRERWDEIFALIRDVVGTVAQHLGLPLKCKRAIDIVSSGMIHPEIWNLIKTADIVICDVTGHNGNVILELGVAAAWRRKRNVVILRDEADDKEHLFDIMPARHLPYRISYTGLPKLQKDLQELMMGVLAAYPFEELPIPSIPLPFEANLTDGKDNPALYTEDITHRRMLNDCLEFGSLLDYRHCWMSLGSLKIADVHVDADLKITRLTSNSDLHPFMGIMVRGSSYYSNLGHLVFIRPTGEYFLTIRDPDTGEGRDEPLDTIPNYAIQQLTHIEISMKGASIRISINGKQVEKDIGQLGGEVYTNGRILFLAAWCRVGIKNIYVKAL